MSWLRSGSGFLAALASGLGGAEGVLGEAGGLEVHPVGVVCGTVCGAELELVVGGDVGTMLADLEGECGSE